jgi:hypothetical protein
MGSVEPRYEHLKVRGTNKARVTIAGKTLTIAFQILRVRPSCDIVCFFNGALGGFTVNTAALIGTWRMLSWTREDVASGKVTDAMGADPIGYLSYHADGRMMALVVNRHRPVLEGVRPTDHEKIALFDSMLAYSGSYTLEDGRVIHHVDASWNPAWGESDLIRPYSLDGDRLLISDAPGIDPTTGDEVIYRLEFRKV